MFCVGDYIVYKDSVMELYDLDISLLKILAIEADGTLKVADTLDVYMPDMLDEDDEDYNICNKNNNYDCYDDCDDYDDYENYNGNHRIDNTYDYENYSYHDNFSEEDIEVIELSPDDVYRVKLKKIDIFKNFIINYYLIMEDSLEEGEERCAREVFEIANRSYDIEELKILLKNRTNFLNKEVSYSDDQSYEECRFQLIDLLDELVKLDDSQIIEFFLSSYDFRYREFYD